MALALTPTELIERQRTDHVMVGALDLDDCPVYITGHRNAADAREGRDPVPVGDKAPPSHYRVTYDFDTLAGPGVRHHPTIVHVAPLANGGYPATPPSAWVISEVVPWTPHFAANVPVCHGGRAWIPLRTQLVDYVIHLGRLLNFDEPKPVPGYLGYNADAIRYWRDELKFKPLDPRLRFPVIRAEDVRRSGVFRSASDGISSNSKFRAAETSLRDGEPARFGPRRRQRRFAPAKAQS